MTLSERADQLGQVVFRLELMLTTLSRHTDNTPVASECVVRMQGDIERLKGFKTDLLIDEAERAMDAKGDAEDRDAT